MMRWAYLLVLVGLCACSPSDIPSLSTAIPTTVLSSTPTPIIPEGARLLAQGEQSEAPVVAWRDDATLVTWIGTDDQAVRHFAQWQLSGQWQPAQALSLLANRPHAQQLVVTSDTITYLLWLDALPTYPEPQRVWYAPISENYAINPGALPLSSIETAQFTALAHADGGIWVVWRGGLLSEPTLYAQYIDRLGRPNVQARLLENAQHPVLLADASGEQWLFWLTDNRLWRGKWDSGQISDPRPLTDSVRLARGALLEQFVVGIAGTNAFAFWHISERDGSYRTFWAMGALTGENWSAPQAHSATWLTPNRLQGDMMFAVGVTTSTPYDLRIYQWTGNTWWAKHTGIIISSGLFRPPTWMRRSDTQAILAWSQPNGLSADLWLWGAD